MMRRLITLLLMSCHLPSFAVEKTVVMDLEQSWQQSSIQTHRLTLNLELSGGLAGNMAWTSIVRGQIMGPDALEPGTPDQPAVSDASQRIYLNDATELELRELYLDVDLQRASLRLGKQQLVWGQADGLKLLDIINPQDYRRFILDDFDDSRIPLWMVNYEMFLGAGDLQILWVPDTSMHNLPEPGALFEVTAPFAHIPANLPHRFEAVDRPANIIKDSDLGLRFSMFVDGWDITANYLYHYDDFPVIRTQFDETGLVLSTEYERSHVIGGSASNAFGDFILRAEVAVNSHKYLATSHNEVEPTAEFGYVVGLDWTGLTDTFLSFQLFQSILLDDNDYIRQTADTNLTFLLKRSFMNESLNIELLWIYHQTDNDNLLRLEGEYELSTNTSVSLFADFFTGQPDELFGQFQDLDRVGVKLSVGF